MVHSDYSTAYYAPKTNLQFDNLMQVYYHIVMENTSSAVQSLGNFYTRIITKLEELKKNKESSLDSTLRKDVEERAKLYQIAHDLEEKHGGNFKGYSQIVNSGLADGVKSVVEQALNDRVMVREYNSAIEMYTKAKERLNESEVRNSFSAFEETLSVMNTPALDQFRRELLEYLISILMGSGEYDSYSPFNLIVQGRPGVGKSYSAAIIAKALSTSMLLPSGNIVFIKKPDVIGQYIGQTAPKVYKKLLEGIGNVVFIDEAYSFAGPKNSYGVYDIFGVEFLDALTDFVSEHKGLISVIAAGYNAEMKNQFLDVNPGLPRRFPVILNLDRYNVNTLYDIFLKTFKSKFGSFSTRMTESFGDKVKDLLYALDTQVTVYTEPGILAERGNTTLNHVYVFLPTEYVRDIDTHIQTTPIGDPARRAVTGASEHFLGIYQYTYGNESQVWDDRKDPTEVTIQHMVRNRVWTAFNLDKCTTVTSGDALAYQSDDMILLADTLGRIIASNTALEGTENITVDDLVDDAFESFIYSRYATKFRIMRDAGNTVWFVFENKKRGNVNYNNTTEISNYVHSQLNKDTDNSSRPFQQYTPVDIKLVQEVFVAGEPSGT